MKSTLKENLNHQYHWNAAEYARHSNAQLEWARELILKLNLNGDESLLDIGCGDGKISVELARCLPNGSVIGIDSSQEMIDLALRSHPESDFPNVSFERLDVREMTFENQFDVVFSNAVLHWIKEHLALLRRIRKSLKKNGRILLQMGGRGNAEDILKVINGPSLMKKWDRYFSNFIFPYGFYGPDEYKKWMAEVGLKAGRIELIPKDMKQKGREGLAGWIRTTWMPATERIPENRREEFIFDLVNEYIQDHPIDENGFVHVKMVRLEVDGIVHT